MAAFADMLARKFQDDPLGFAIAFGDFIAGVGGPAGTNANRVMQAFGNHNWTPDNFGVGPSTGPGGKPTPQDLVYPGAFKPQFRDSLNPAEDQSHHFAAFVELGAIAGSTATDQYAYLLDRKPRNEGDIRLGAMGGLLGALLRDGELPVLDAGKWIREFICNP